MRALFEVADILNNHWDAACNALHLNGWQCRTLDAVRRCRTAALGGHVDACDQCGHVRISYNSCRNRHCPKCQGQKRERWMDARMAELLPVPYFHVVFTLPEGINRLALYKPAAVYGLLFKTAWSTMQTFAADPVHLGALTGMIAILHTWGQTLSLHPHLHCVVPGGGLTKAGHWKTARSKGKFLFPVKGMSKVFRARYVEGLRKAFPEEPKEFFNSLFDKPWVIYAKRPFGGPAQVMEYLSRYTHKVAISNHRLLDVSGTTVTFGYKDYRQQGYKKVMTLDALEFIRRFTMHILPKGFVRIRHYGVLASSVKANTLPAILKQFGIKLIPDKVIQPPLPINDAGYPCPCCKKGRMQIVLSFDYRGPPTHWKELCNILTPAQEAV
jgi:hypothetical protein